MDDFFSFETPVQNKALANREPVSNPFLKESKNPSVQVLIADYLSPRQIDHLDRFFKTVNITEYNLVYPFPFIPEEKDFNKGLTKFFIENVSKNLPIIQGLPLITFGRGLLAVTKDPDVYVSGFYDTVFNKSYFYSADFNTQVFPCDSIFRILGFGQPDKKTGEPVIVYDRWETEFAKRQLKAAAKRKDCSLKNVPQIEIVEITDSKKFFQDNDKPEIEFVAWDLETAGFNRLSDEIVCLTMSWDGKTAYYFDWENVDVKAFYDFISKRKSIGANLKFDTVFVANHGAPLLEIYWDSMVGGHMLNEMRSNSLKTHAWIYTVYGGYDLELEIFKMKYKKLESYKNIPKPLLKKYAGMDAAVNFLVFKAQLEQFEQDPKLLEYFYQYAMPMVNLFAEAELTGIPVDWDEVTRTAKFLDDKILESKKAVLKAFNVPSLNIDSKKQLGEFIESLGWPCISRVKASIGGYYKVSKDEIHEWVKMGYKEAATLREYSRWISIKSTFIGEDEYDSSDEGWDDDFFSGEETGQTSQDSSGLWKYKTKDGKVHSTFHTFMAASHRNRSSDPNLQNIPKKDYEIAELVRRCYTVPDHLACSKQESTKVVVRDKRFGYVEFKPEDIVRVRISKTEYLEKKAIDLEESDDLFQESPVKEVPKR